MSSEDTTLNRIADSLERIAAALEMTAQKPAWVESAEKVLNTAQTVRQTTDKVEKPSVKKAEPTPQTPPKGVTIGSVVDIVAGKHKGKQGKVTEFVKAWIYVDIDGTQQAVRHREIATANGEEKTEAVNTVEDNNELKAIENANKPKQEMAVDFAPSDNPTDPENFIVKGGKHKGKSLYTLFSENGMGAKTVRWMANQHPDPETKEAAVALIVKLEGEA